MAIVTAEPATTPRTTPWTTVRDLATAVLGPLVMVAAVVLTLTLGRGA